MTTNTKCNQDLRQNSVFFTQRKRTNRNVVEKWRLICTKKNGLQKHLKQANYESTPKVIYLYKLHLMQR